MSPSFVATTTLFLFHVVYGGDSSVTCSIVTENPFNYTCSAMGILTTTEMQSIAATNFGCAQTSISGLTGSSDSATLNYTSDGMIGCTDISAEYVIQCIAFAGTGLVGGACTQMATGSAESCDFKEDPSGSFVWLSQAIGNQCIGKQKCDITSTYNGYKYNDISYDLRTVTGSGQSTNLDSCCANSTELKFKFVIYCGSNTTTTTTATPTIAPTNSPSVCVSKITLTTNVTTQTPTKAPTKAPTAYPTTDPTLEPTLEPTTNPVTPMRRLLSTSSNGTSSAIDTIIGNYSTIGSGYGKTNNDGNQSLIYWNGTHWIIGEGTNNTLIDIIAICIDTAQSNNSSPVDCNEYSINYAVGESTNTSISVAAGSCGGSVVVDCWTEPFKGNCWIYWSIAVAGVVCFCLILGCIIYCLCTRRENDEENEVVDDVIASEDEKEVLMSEAEVKDKLDLSEYAVNEKDRKEMLEMQRKVSESIGLQAD